MKNIFIINPAAGTTRMGEKLIGSIHDAARETGMDCDIYFTKYAGDCERYINEICSENPDIEFRFFGAGGDGTLNEVINGCYGHSNAVAGIIPIGTGNDFIRIFDRDKAFMNMSQQLMGSSMEIDLIRCEYTEHGEDKIRYCDNMINIGFDSNVVVKAAEIKKKGVITGSGAYLLGVGCILLKKKGADLRIELDNGYVHDGPLLLVAAANGQYCGGGVKSSPESVLDDGLIEVSVIKDISRTKFVSLYPSYAKGTHFNRKGADKMMDYHRVKSLRLKTNKEPMKVSNDGEIVITDEIRLEVVQRAVRFSVPAID